MPPLIKPVVPRRLRVSGARTSPQGAADTGHQRAMASQQLAARIWGSPGLANFRLAILGAALGATLGATLAGCGSAPPSVSATAPTPKPVPIDGTYGGVMQLSRGEIINCGNQNPITLQVKNQTFTYRLDQPQADWRPTIVFIATIGPDGSFNARSGPDSMSGQVQGGAMQGQIIGDICEFSFVADRGGVL
jgi:hypothetical protein